MSVRCGDSLPPLQRTVLADYPKYGVWSNSYILTTRDVGRIVPSGVSVCALEKSKMIQGDPNPGVKRLSLQLTGDPNFDSLLGDLLQLMPPDIDGNNLPPPAYPAPIISKQDDDWGAPRDALNIFELFDDWEAEIGNFSFKESLDIVPYDSQFTCFPFASTCIPQPGAAREQYLDVQSLRLLHRFAYRIFGCHESMAVVGAVEAREGVAGKRWYTLRRINDGEEYHVYQQGTFAPDDGISRWTGSVAMDGAGNMAMGYSVSSDKDVYPGIRYTARMADDPLNKMTLGEKVIAHGSGIQKDPSSGRGDYSSMNIDPTDDCTFWYTNEYYTSLGEFARETIDDYRYYQRRIASFTLPGCIENVASAPSKSIKCPKDNDSGWRRRLGKGM